jgi:kinesin family member 2/24
LRRRLEHRNEQRVQQSRLQKAELTPAPKASSFSSDCAFFMNDSQTRVRPGEEDKTPEVQAASQMPRSVVVPNSRHALGRSPSGGVSRRRTSTVRETSPSRDEGGRQMFDKHTLRVRHRELFLQAIVQHQQIALRTGSRTPPLPARTPRQRSNAVKVYIRVRPIFERDTNQNGDFDVVSVLPGQLIVHNCLFEADLKTPFINHHFFEFNHIFGHTALNDEVYNVAASDVVLSACKGGFGTIFMFGQTGSGKTHTMTAIEELSSYDLFSHLSRIQQDASDEPLMSIQFLELRGDRCFDLLARVSKGCDFPELRLREHSNGAYKVEGAMELYPESPDELLVVLRTAHARRKTSATGANHVSSRSHAVCIIQLLHSGGQLVFVDCAGSERKKDSMYHTKERQQESAEINTSLYALKECVRHFSTQQRVPSHAYRASSLTKVLADAFISGDKGKLVVICTVSPCATDTEHTISTVRMGSALTTNGTEREEKEMLTNLLREQRGPRELHPKQWSPEQVRAWLTDLHDGAFRDVLSTLPLNTTGQMLVRLTETRCIQLCGGSVRRGHLLFKLLHKVINHIEALRRPSL